MGIQRFWTPEERPSPLLRRFECLPIFCLARAGDWLTFKAEMLMRFTQATANSLNNPEHYVMAVMATRPVPSPQARPPPQEVQP
jgi:multicomponent K+:H+ antiporter subunit D